jgi:hypothetical protein
MGRETRKVLSLTQLSQSFSWDRPGASVSIIVAETRVFESAKGINHFAFF